MASEVIFGSQLLLFLLIRGHFKELTAKVTQPGPVMNSFDLDCNSFAVRGCMAGKIGGGGIIKNDIRHTFLLGTYVMNIRQPNVFQR